MKLQIIKRHQRRSAAAAGVQCSLILYFSKNCSANPLVGFLTTSDFLGLFPLPVCFLSSAAFPVESWSSADIKLREYVDSGISALVTVRRLLLFTFYCYCCSYSFSSMVCIFAKTECLLSMPPTYSLWWTAAYPSLLPAITCLSNYSSYFLFNGLSYRL